MREYGYKEEDGKITQVASSIFQSRLEKLGYKGVSENFDEFIKQSGLDQKEMWYTYKIIDKYIVEFPCSENKSEIEALGGEAMDTDLKSLMGWAGYQRMKKYRKEMLEQAQD